MPNTSEGFYYPDASTNIAPLETVLANMAASSDTVSKQTPRVFANYAAMVAGIPSPVGGRLAITTQGSGILWQYDGTAAKWVVQNRPTFSGATARDAAIPSPTAGVVAVIGTGASYSETVHDGSAWLPVVERGSNANGSFVKLASGLQICWLQTARTDIAINAAYGPLFLGGYTWTFPAAFKAGSVPAVTCGQFQSGTAGGWGTVSGVPNYTQASLRGIDAFSVPAGPSVLISATAIGVWR